MRRHLGLMLAVVVVNTAVLAGCLPPPGGPEPRHHRGGPPPQPEGQPPEGTTDRNPPPPTDRTPPPPEGDTDRTRAGAPQHHHQPSLTITLSTSSTRPGSEVSLYVNPARQPLIVYFNGRILPKKTDPSGTVLTVTIPADGTSGMFEIEWSGQRFRSPYLTIQ